MYLECNTEQNLQIKIDDPNIATATINTFSTRQFSSMLDLRCIHKLSRSIWYYFLCRDDREVLGSISQLGPRFYLGIYYSLSFRNDLGSKVFFTENFPPSSNNNNEHFELLHSRAMKQSSGIESPHSSDHNCIAFGSYLHLLLTNI